MSMEKDVNGKELGGNDRPLCRIIRLLVEPLHHHSRDYRILYFYIHHTFLKYFHRALGLPEKYVTQVARKAAVRIAPAKSS